MLFHILGVASQPGGARCLLLPAEGEGDEGPFQGYNPLIFGRLPLRLEPAQAGAVEVFGPLFV